MINHACKNASVPNGHIYGLVDRHILTTGRVPVGQEYERCVIFGLTSIPSRAWHFSILCESGAQWAHIPIHMLRHTDPETDIPHDLPILQCWDCHGWDYSVTAYEYLRDMTCEFRPYSKGASPIPASYWFTADHTDNGFSAHPSEHKAYHFLLLEDGSGQIAAMPNNRVRWRDHSFTDWSKPLDYSVMADITWHAETMRESPDQTAITAE